MPKTQLKTKPQEGVITQNPDEIQLDVSDVPDEPSGSRPLMKVENEDIVPTRPMGEIETLISQAISRSVPVETMEKLLTMRRELKAEQAKEEYDVAMAKLQSELPVIEKKNTAGSGGFSYKFAPLEFIIEKTKTPISKNGFSYYFDTEEDNSFMTIFCNTTHSGGHTKTSKFKLPIDKSGRMNATQQYGSALTYGKRYCFCNAFGIVVGGEDTDGVEAEKQKETKQTQAPTPQQKTQTAPTQSSQSEVNKFIPMTDYQRQKIEDLLAKKGKTIAHAMSFSIKHFNVKWPNLSLEQANKLHSSFSKLEDYKSKEEVDPDEVDAGIAAQKGNK